RTPGLAGARNTGILALDTELVAFCDDDDAWLPEKLTAQTAALVGRPDAVLASCGILVRFRGDDNARLAGSAEVTHADLIRSRMRGRWGRRSRFAGEYGTKIEGLRWMLANHPELAADPVGSARVYGQIAFWNAGLGRRREALSWVGRAMRANWRERRVPFALAVASGLVSDERVLRTLHAKGHGI